MKKNIILLLLSFIIIGALIYFTKREDNIFSVNIVNFNESNYNSHFFQNKIKFIISNFLPENTILFYSLNDDPSYKLKDGMDKFFFDKFKNIGFFLKNRYFSDTKLINNNSTGQLNFMVKSEIIEMQNIKFFIIKIFEVNESNNQINNLNISDSPVRLIQNKINQYEKKYDYIIISGKIPIETVGKICMGVSKINLFIWINSDYELHKEKKVWNEVPVINPGIDNEYIGITKINFIKSNRLFHSMNTELASIKQ
ncbi:hypothetical protein KA977_13210 [Candidatus Dependentiae bacterium]|nr:hypothetical protein [Candidatus Dependentiae bacterium]